ncbi:DUF1465 family protein [Enterovirga sp.]|jgi:regulator of CtrA degradation|uniref:protease adaptor protein RcdA n=1 Tax=Enterovirga sp. TaxID=2026350 RepID=UPI00261F2A35|nr:DUF1465 family protein [Enterovirga sp.]MDB5589489.1 AraC family transcriptional regulator [Enterovirga sp.]
MLREVERAPHFAASGREGAVAFPFGASFVKSEAFKTLFREGMSLVEETACYLDGDGRTESDKLNRSAALAYASESMRLTTRLMQIASWLLVQRAVAEGEITAAQALREKERVKLAAQEQASPEAVFAALPERIRELVALSLRLHARIRHLDRLMATASEAALQPSPSPATQQLHLLRSIFEVA